MQQDKQQNTILRVALYCRVSTEEQVLHGYSMQAQEDALVSFAYANNMKVVDIYRDEGNSARKPALQRPVMQKLLEDVRAGKIDRILFVKLDRWFRNVREYHKVQAILDQYGATWQATTEDYNTATTDGRFKVNVSLSFAEAEADKASDRSKLVFQSKLNRKEAYFPTQCLPLGYTIRTIDGVKRVVKDPETEHIVNEFFRIALAYSVRRASIEMAERFGCKRAYNTWLTMTKKEIYTGNYKGVPDYCPAYITQEEFETLNSRWHIIKKTQNNRVYMFTGLVRCPLCGRILKGTYTINSSKEEWYYYRCQYAISGTCDFKRSVSERRIERYLLENVRKELEGCITQAEIGQEKEKGKPKVPESERLQERLRRINKAFFDGNMSDDDYTEQSGRVKAEIEKAKAKEAQNKPADTEALRAFLNSDFETIYGTLDKEDKRRLWRSIIRNIRVDENRKVVGINFIT